MPLSPGQCKQIYPGRVIRIGKTIDWEQLSKQTRSRSDDGATIRDKIGTANQRGRVESSNDEKGAAQSRMGNNEREASSDKKGPSVRYSTNGVTSEPKAQKKPLAASKSVAERLQELMDAETVDLEALRKTAWGGMPPDCRPLVWKLLLRYVPSNAARRSGVLEQKRRDYREAVVQYYHSANDLRGEQEHSTLRQIAVDIPRTSPGQALFHISEVQSALERILYVWATRHPASGYVQGMNDLVTPFFYVFLSEYVEAEDKSEMLKWTSLKHLKSADMALANAEADSYWCLTSLLSGIQDYYTFAQPGIQRRVLYLRELVGRVDEPLKNHLETEGLDFLQFAFRWMNCLLMRELPFSLIVRVWDTYLAEPDGFATFHVFVCAALLVSFREKLLLMEFQDLVMFLQHLPTSKWSNKEIDVLLSQAYMWRSIFGAAPSHLQRQQL